MTHSLSRSLRCALLLAAIAAAPPAAQQSSAPPPAAPPPAQQDQAPAQPPPRFRTEANYVRVDAYPTRDGKPVQDLTAEDFEVLEDGDLQMIAAFEHVVVKPFAEGSRVEPGSVREAERQAGEARRRVFVIFLDIGSVGAANSRRMMQPLKTLIERLVGPDDLVGLATPYMAASDITLGRRTEIIERGLSENPFWGVSDTLTPATLDERERMYDSCYPPGIGEGVRSVLAAKMIARRRERLALGSLRDVAIYLGSIREERKAIIAVTEGWPLYTEDQSMLALRGNERPPGPPPIGVGPDGRLTMNPNRDLNEVHDDVCSADRMTLATLDDPKYFRDLLQDANRANASYYPVNAGGLQVFADSFGPSSRDVSASMAEVRSRVSTLRELAENTDGLAIVDTNDLDGGMRRIVDDLSSYYLLGYYSSNSKQDGGYRRITVRVKRPGVQVRARRGYRAATAAEISAARAATSAPAAEAAKPTTSALAALARLDGAARLHLHAVPVLDAGGRATAVWIAGELKMPLNEFAAGGNATIELPGGAAAPASASIAPRERTFLVKVPVQNAGEAIDLRVRLAAAGSADPPLTDSIRVNTDASAAQPLLFRRGPSTGNRVQPAADYTFSRTERLRLELPVAADAAPGAGRFLDRNGQPLQIPVQLGQKDADGQRWLTADAVLSPLGAGDYVVEMKYTAAGAEHTVLTAIRVTR